MATKLIDELTPEAKQKALSDFTAFYLDKYRHEGLDLIAQIDEKGDVADINHWLMANRAFSTAELIAGLLANRRENLTALLRVLQTPFNENGIPDTPWNDWFKATLATIPQGR
ncbi:hypothetical protein ACFQ5J_03985 [Lacticaseibacillus baoqingensis]|uniref:Uncharacterized protein n=1 Tax=Lacticaseibacillus baoqingensis TaxID=2486013 RepID=A0ABW4E6N0_9LACO|nr:hypothetical protein [Lacticaseibacillus baoqingensis]